MLLPNRKPAISTIDLHNRFGNRPLRKRLEFPLLILLMLVPLVMMVMSVRVGPALAFESVPDHAASAATTPNDFLDDVTLWSATMTARTFPSTPNFTGYSSYHSVGRLDGGADFVAGGQAYTINVLALSPFENALGIRVSPDLDVAEASKWILLVDEAEFAFADADMGLGYQDNETLVIWAESGLDWEEGRRVALRLIEWEPGTCPVGEGVDPDMVNAEGSD